MSILSLVWNFNSNNYSCRSVKNETFQLPRGLFLAYDVSQFRGKLVGLGKSGSFRHDEKILRYFLFQKIFRCRTSKSRSKSDLTDFWAGATESGIGYSTNFAVNIWTSFSSWLANRNPSSKLLLLCALFQKRHILYSTASFFKYRTPAGKQI